VLTDGSCVAATTTTGDVASRDDEGYITYVGRSDDVFKAADYRNLAVRAGERG